MKNYIHKMHDVPCFCSAGHIWTLKWKQGRGRGGTEYLKLVKLGYDGNYNLNYHASSFKHLEANAELRTLLPWNGH